MTDERPEGVPDEAVLEWGRHWALGKHDGKTKVGEWRRWHKTEGYLLAVDEYDEQGKQVRQTAYFPDGTVQQIIPMTKGIPDGVCVYYRSDDFSDATWDRFPGEAVRSEVVWYGGSSSSPRRFFDADGREISWAGAAKPDPVPAEAYSDESGRWGVGGSDLAPDLSNAEQLWDSLGNALSDDPADLPHPEASPVKNRGESFWRHVDGGVTTYWDSDQELRWRVVRTGEDITEVTTYASGEPVVEESFYAGNTLHGCLVPKLVVIHDGDERVEFSGSEDGGVSEIVSYLGKEEQSRLNNRITGVTHATFVNEFQARFGAAMDHDEVILSAAGVEVMEVGGYHNEEFVECVGLTHRGNGDIAFVFLETDYAGPVYYNDHEVGPFGLDCIDDLLDDEGIEPESATKEEIAEAFPCVEDDTVLAASIDAYLHSVSVASDFTFWGRHEDFAS